MLRQALGGHFSGGDGDLQRTDGSRGYRNGEDGAEVVGSTPREFTAFLKAEMQKWGKVIKDAGIQPD